MPLDEKKFILGERRRVTLDTWLVTNRPFVIKDAKWELFRKDERVAHGKLTKAKANNHWLLQALIEPAEPGHYLLVYTYYLGDERMVRNLKIHVKKC